MKIMTLDPKLTHQNNPDCPSRLAPMPGGGWMCVDCGFQLVQKLLDSNDESVRRSMERLKEMEEAYEEPRPALGGGVYDDPVQRHQEHREMAVRRAEEGVATPEEHTPTHSTLHEVLSDVVHQGRRMRMMLERWEAELSDEVEHGPRDSTVGVNHVLGRVKEVLYSSG